MADKKTQRNQDDAGRIRSQAIDLAEQLGRIAGTMEGTAEVWLNRPSLRKQLMRVRDGAAQLLASVSGGKARSRKGVKATVQAKLQSVDFAHAPGKRHRQPAPTLHGAKKSDLRIPKLRSAEEARHRRRSWA